MAIADIAAKSEITDEGEVDEYLGVKVQCKRWKFQADTTWMIKQILTALGFNKWTKPKILQPYQARSYRETQKVWITRRHGITVMSNELSRKVKMSRHFIWSLSMCEICYKPKNKSHASYSKNWQITYENKKHGNEYSPQCICLGTEVWCRFFWKLAHFDWATTKCRTGFVIMFTGSLWHGYEKFRQKQN